MFLSQRRSPRNRLLLDNLAQRVSELLEVQEARLEKVIDWPERSDTSSSPGVLFVGSITEKCG